MNRFNGVTSNRCNFRKFYHCVNGLVGISVNARSSHINKIPHWVDGNCVKFPINFHPERVYPFGESFPVKSHFIVRCRIIKRSLISVINNLVSQEIPITSYLCLSVFGINSQIVNQVTRKRSNWVRAPCTSAILSNRVKLKCATVLRQVA